MSPAAWECFFEIAARYCLLMVGGMFGIGILMIGFALLRSASKASREEEKRGW